MKARKQWPIKKISILFLFFAIVSIAQQMHSCMPPMLPPLATENPKNLNSTEEKDAVNGEEPEYFSTDESGDLCNDEYYEKILQNIQRGIDQRNKKKKEKLRTEMQQAVAQLILEKQEIEEINKTSSSCHKEQNRFYLKELTESRTRGKEAMRNYFRQLDHLEPQKNMPNMNTDWLFSDN